MQRTVIILIALYFGIALYSCSLRDAELPVTSRSTFYPPTTPELVTVNLMFSIIEKDKDNYMKCFVDTSYSPRRYTYQPDVASGNQYPIFRLWNLSNEKTYYTSLLSLTDPSATSNLFFSNSTLQPFGDTAFFDAEYLLRVDHQKTNVAKTLKGNIRLILSADSRNLWSIHRWIDIQATAADTTWSVLRANFSN
ncbi:MAG: hypothetical protein ACOYN6_06070 [Ignavibacteria bacterium]